MLDIEWVRSHQDSSDITLSLEATLNVEADRLASLALQTSTEIPGVPLRGPECIAIKVEGRSITNCFRKRIIEAHATPAMLQSIRRRTGWGQEVLDLICWPALKAGTLSFSAHQQVTLTKHTNGMLPLGCRILRTGAVRSKLCPRCQECEETDAHFFSCALGCDDAKPIKKGFRESLEESSYRLRGYQHP